MHKSDKWDEIGQVSLASSPASTCRGSHCLVVMEMQTEPEEFSLLDSCLHYALFVGAIFQLICIFAVVFVPGSEGEKEEQEESVETSEDVSGATEQSATAPMAGSSGGRRRHEKKKRK